MVSGAASSSATAAMDASCGNGHVQERDLGLRGRRHNLDGILKWRGSRAAETRHGRVSWKIFSSGHSGAPQSGEPGMLTRVGYSAATAGSSTNCARYLLRFLMFKRYIASNSASGNEWVERRAISASPHALRRGNLS